ncbi:hypothetical protein [Shewanella sp. MBTL60-007]|uniref:hypothetical protein n=1 Tax=Shewanella sp. MBTL60-007 TaxID=2815911 RepID=UPI001BBED5F8|nr:hypothetical protein [Shewanella sp. MBTL60-007]GIU15898.1 hypothetical protein TUM3792_08880 [Shewanella sp. MBTL60-007]
MCGKQNKVDELERELKASRMREAKLLKTLAETLNYQSQAAWKPWKMMMIPVCIFALALVVALVR